MSMSPEIAAAEPAQPYWERWPQILSYPLQGAALSTIVALAVAQGVVNLLPGLLSFFGSLIVWAGFFKYAFEVLRWSANGRDNAPEISFTVSDVIGRYSVLLLILLEALLNLIAIWYGWLPALIAGLAIMFVMPAIVTMLALDEAMVGALNPIAWFSLIGRLRGTYFVLVGFFCAALIAQSLIAAMLGYILPGIFAVPVAYVVVNYLMIANFHLIGYVIHQYRDELGYAGELELQETAAGSDPTQAVIASARSRAASGDARGAATLLRDEIKNYPSALALHVEYRHWLDQCEEKAELAAHGAQFIPILLAQNQTARAVDIARESLQLDRAFALDNADDISRVAAAAAEAGQTQVALGLLAGFHKRFRNHPDIARNYLMAAKLLAERMNKEMPARALLQQIKVALPNDPVMPQVDAYLAFLDKLAATPTQVKPATPAQ
jgi:hypothetical protein